MWEMTINTGKVAARSANEKDNIHVLKGNLSQEESLELLIVNNHIIIILQL